MFITSYPLYSFALCITWTYTQDSPSVFFKVYVLKGNCWKTTVVMVDICQNVQTLDQRKNY